MISGGDHKMNDIVFVSVHVNVYSLILYNPSYNGEIWPIWNLMTKWTTDVRGLHAEQSLETWHGTQGK